MMRTFMKKPGLFLVIVSLLLWFPSCLGKKPGMGKDVSTKENGEYLLFLSAMQGNPLGIFVSVQKMRVPGTVGSASTKWQAHVWGLIPGASPCLFAEKGKDKSDLGAPVNWKNDALLFTTDKDQFVFYKPLNLDKLLLLTDSLFADRVRRSREEVIRYGLMPSSLYWNNRKIEGNLFYEKRERSESMAHTPFLPLTGLSSGERSYVLWSPDGLFLRVEKQGGEQGLNPSFVALMQDRRGRWEETYEGSLEEPACLFSSASCTGPADDIRLQIPLWRLNGQLESLRDVKTGAEAQDQEPHDEEEVRSGGRVLWMTLKEFTEENGESSVNFCLLKGTLEIDRETRAVYGFGMMGK